MSPDVQQVEDAEVESVLKDIVGEDGYAATMQADAPLPDAGDFPLRSLCGAAFRGSLHNADVVLRQRNDRERAWERVRRSLGEG